jgi:SMI1-KNR4 cell-wall
MNNIQVSERGKYISEADIGRLEQELGERLPEEYRRFLLAHNGGHPSSDVIDIDGAPFGSVDVRHLFSIDNPSPSCDLVWNLRFFSKRMSDSLLAIGCDSSGHLFCLVLHGEQRGEIYYFDREQDPPEPYFVAKDFDSFWSRLRVFTSDEEDMIKARSELSVVVSSE